MACGTDEFCTAGCFNKFWLLNRVDNGIICEYTTIHDKTSPFLQDKDEISFAEVPR